MLKPLPPGLDEIQIHWAGNVQAFQFQTEVAFRLTVEQSTPSFLRGDTNGVGGVDVSDAIATLSFLFLGAGEPDCPDAADADDTGSFGLEDPIYLLNWLFLGSAKPPPSPGPSQCGVDPTSDTLLPCTARTCS